MSFQGVKINKLNGGFGRRNPSTDNVFMLAACMPLTGTTLTNYSSVKLLQATDAEALGITQAYDANEGVLVYNAIVSFFTYCPDGVLHLVACETNKTVTQLLAIDSFKTAVRQTPNAKVIGVLNTTNTLVNIDTEVERAQAFVDDFKTEFRYIDAVILEGKGAADTITPITSYPNLRAKNAPNVSVSIAQDPAVVALDSVYEKYADIGSVLGMLAVRQVNENLGSVDILNKPSDARGQQDYPLNSASPLKWQSANLSSGQAFNTLSKQHQIALTNSGYIYAGSFDGYGGTFLNSSPTCVAKSSDYAYIENNRVWNKASRIIRQTLIPRVRGVIKKNPQTGYIRSSTVSDWNSRLNKALEVMITNNEISGFDFYINPKQVIDENTPLKVKGHIVTDGIVFEFDVDLGLTDKL